MKKLVFIIITIIFLIIGVISLRKINNNIKKHNIQVQLEKDIEESRKLKDIDDGSIWTTKGETLKLLSKHNVEWEKILVPEELKKEYMQKYPNGLFGDDDYDECIIEDYLKYEAGQYFEPNDFIFYTIKGKRKNKYKIHVGDEQFCHIYKIEKIELFDNNGDYVWKGYPMDEDNWVSNIQKIALQDDEEVGRSEKFDIEHPNFTGLLNPYNEDIDDLKIYILEEQCDFANKICVCEVYYCNRYIYVTYKINYTVDDFNYLDTVELEELNSREYEWDDYNKYLNSTGIAIKVLLRNRDMNKVPFTKKLINNLNNGLIGYDIVSFRRIKYAKGQNNNQNLYKIVLTNGKVKFIGLKYKFLNNKIDDIIVTELPITDETFNNYSTKELYDMF